ncbi:hypothetical protein BDL97_06G025800 [Sphagnum fallax]|nr:hypothetical protein BDL97_06G025800 [Sphagnum fallax]
MASSISVKDISEMGAVKVPSKFILNATELATIVPHNYFSDEQVPVIDLAGLDDNSQGEATMAAIANACENWGFFQVETCFGTQHNTTPINGYGHQYRKAKNRTDDWHDLFFQVQHPLTAKALENLPTTPAAYRDTMEKYADGVLKLMHQILEIFSTLLGLQPKYLEERFGNPIINTRTNFYPPCPQRHLVLGLAAHSDPNSMTVLFQG